MKAERLANVPCPLEYVQHRDQCDICVALFPLLSWAELKPRAGRKVVVVVVVGGKAGIDPDPDSPGGLWDSVKKAAFVIGSGILFLAAFGNSLTW
ncbi:hypothetical protein INR49_009540 [Caranx melampygus]|nr:hypothetical protein INR49_009540 [Caranx melampygus]